jgi:hypothetical protein
MVPLYNDKNGFQRQLDTIISPKLLPASRKVAVFLSDLGMP